MKKFLKVFIIALLVIAVIGVTCYIFFRNLRERDNTTQSFATFLMSEEKTEFDNNLSSISAIINSEEAGYDDRLVLMLETSKNLDHVIFSLSTYNIANNTQINNKAISDSLKRVINSRKLLARMFKEFKLKTSSSYFDKNEGANDLYNEMCNYLKEYANLADLLNNYVSGINRNSDIKFNVFNVYSKIVKQAFSDTKEESGLVIISDVHNIEKINNIISFTTDSRLTINDRFSMNINKFNEYYSQCNKENFAKNFSENVDSVSTANQDSNEKIATYYFKLVFEIS